MGAGGFAEAVDLGGSSSLNLLVGGAESRYVVRVHRPHVTPERLGAVHLARRTLLAGGVPCAPPVPGRRGADWVRVEGRLVEVEAWVDHDAVMDSWPRLEVGMGLRAQVHTRLRGLAVGEEGRRPRFANHLAPVNLVASVRQGVERICGWEPTPAERRLADLAEELAEVVAQAEAGLVTGLLSQLVHGDVWDNNVARLVARYDAALDLPQSATERAALPMAMARQPLSSIGGWVARLDDQAAARRHAAGTGPELAAARQLMTELGRWQDAFA